MGLFLKILFSPIAVFRGNPCVEGSYAGSDIPVNIITMNVAAPGGTPPRRFYV